MAAGNKSRAGSDTISTIIGADTTLTGDLTLQGSVRIDGNVTGNIHCDGEVTIGREGSVDGDVDADVVVLGGKLNGRLLASVRLVMESTASLTGDLATTALEVAEGARFDGTCAMGPEAIKAMKAMNSSATLPDDGNSESFSNKPVVDVESSQGFRLGAEDGE